MAEPSKRLSRETRWLVGILAAFVGLLSLTTIPEVFTLDECNYLQTVRALREGSVFVPGTEGFTPTAELSGFDPSNTSRAVHTSPVAPTVPPLYAPIALPFVFFGMRAFILLNAIAFAVTAGLVFALTKRHARSAGTPWIAAGTYLLGGFGIEYAQGMWPHMIAISLVTGGFYLATRAGEEGRSALALAAGLALGVAAGIRYQNIVIAAAIGATLLFAPSRRWRSAAYYAVGVAMPVGATSLINHARLGTYNPFSKGAGYLPSLTQGGGSLALSVQDKLTTFYAMVVDYSAHPAFQDPMGAATLPKSPGTGVFLVVGGMKKALLQSAPWIAIALLAIAIVWSSRLSLRIAITDEKRSFLRRLSLPVFAVLALFTWAGLARHDGWGFNQRYLLELIPFFAISLALVTDSWVFDPKRIVIGGAIGIALAAIPIALWVPENALRQRGLTILPLVLAGAVVILWLFQKNDGARWAVLAACVGWALAVHVGDDLVAERGLRNFNGAQRALVASALPDGPTALVAIAPQKEAMCPLQLDHNLVMTDPSADGAATARTLTGELLAKDRRVFVVGRMPRPYLLEVFAGHPIRSIAKAPIPLAEVLAEKATPADAPDDRTP